MCISLFTAPLPTLTHTPFIVHTTYLVKVVHGPFVNSLLYNHEVYFVLMPYEYVGKCCGSRTVFLIHWAAASAPVAFYPTDTNDLKEYSSRGSLSQWHQWFEEVFILGVHYPTDTSDLKVYLSLGPLSHWQQYFEGLLFPNNHYPTFHSLLGHGTVKKNLPGPGFTKVEKHQFRIYCYTVSLCRAPCCAGLCSNSLIRLQSFPCIQYYFCKTLAPKQPKSF